MKLKSRFFLKVIFLYCLIIIAGLVSGLYIITSGTINSLLEAEKRFEEQIQRQTKDYVEQLFVRLDDIYIKMYAPDYYGISLESLINPRNPTGLNKKDREIRISEKLYTVSYSHSFIIDVLLIDYSKRSSFFSTKGSGRLIKEKFDYFNSSLSERLAESTNEKILIPNYIPEYLMKHANSSMNMPVLIIAQNVFDIDHYNPKKPIGILICSINPLIFSEQMKTNNMKIRGNYIITDQNNEIIYNSKRVNLTHFYPGDVNLNDFLLTNITSEATGLNFYNVLDKDIFFEEINNHRFSILKVILLSMFFLILISIGVSKTIDKRIKRLTDHMELVEQGILDRPLIVRQNDEIGYLENGFNEMCRQLDQYISMVYLSEIKIKNVKLKLLQDQINPHFMYNTLESIHMTALMHHDTETAEMVHILGELFRWTVHKNEIIINLREEIEYIKEYCHLQSIRYENNFKLEIQIPKDFLEFGIPKMTFQPIIENTLYHGFGNRENGGILTIAAFKSGNSLLLEILDNGYGMNSEQLTDLNHLLNEVSDEEDHSHIGLVNVNSRLRMFFGSDYSLDICSGENEGLKVSIKIPQMPYEEMRDNV